MANVNEYLFIDKVRVDAYFEQLASTVKLVKLPAWKVAFGLTGPTVEGTQSTAIQTYGVHEKVSTLISKLNPFRGEPTAFHGDDGDFVFETMNATRAFIPTGVCKRQDFPGVAIWLATRASVKHSLQGFRYLIEDFQQEDRAQARSSGYSVVQTLFWELKNELKGTPLEAFPEVKEPPRVVKVSREAMHHLSTTYIDTFRNDHGLFATETEAYSADKERTLRQILTAGGIHDYDNDRIQYRGVDNNNRNRERHSFDIFVADQIHAIEITEANDANSEGVAEIKRDRLRELENLLVHEPARILRELGATVSSPRKIDCLFRIRESGESASGLTLIGYPIFIAESPCTFNID